MKSTKPYLFVKLGRKPGKLKIEEFSEKKLKAFLRRKKVRDPLKAESYNLRVFKSHRRARRFLKRYIRILKGLSNRKICKSRDLPTMLYKRHFIVLSIMKIKNQTERHYAKDWKRGQLFNLFDQTYFLTVKLDSLKRVGRAEYVYKVRIPR